MLKSPPHGDVVALAKYRITHATHLPIYIQDAINMLIDMIRLLDLRADIDHAQPESKSIAAEFIDPRHTTPQLEHQIDEVHAKNGPARD